ncbi:hypothetical protein EJ06DRAFT_557495 [Trichodelitschia bisporula]|uniref:Tcp11-domain-containing protein n=1 Tax=Trichodelitschia bisporula TaxID=703511 RepID=A0A6G1HSW5_9PEZI|nr:hypothetical protein EJ06DRAFT_557495 [Trichodelitschia bisporula]
MTCNPNNSSQPQQHGAVPQHISALKDLPSTDSDTSHVIYINPDIALASRSSSASPPPTRESRPDRQPLLDNDLRCYLWSIEVDPELAYDAFTSANIDPPITPHSLGELDIGSIAHNLKLRHDINYDFELHFRPNLDGAKGARKRATQELYWRAVTVELNIVMRLCAEPWDARREALFKASQRRIPRLFDVLKEILKNLVPETDKSTVDDHLDVGVLMQEIGRGLCDFVSIAMWLAQLLKRHCAPMRDGMVDRMVDRLRAGTPQDVSKGLLELFGVLEAMKLDVANHQIRHLRYLLIEDTISFEQSYHAKRIERRPERINPRQARTWFLEQTEAFTPRGPHGDFEAFARGLVRMLVSALSLHELAADMPNIFELDAERLRAASGELNDLLFQNVCVDVLGELVSTRSRGARCPTPADEARLRMHLAAIVADPAARGWSCNADYIALELVRHALRIVGEEGVEYDAALVNEVQGSLHRRFHDPLCMEEQEERLEAVVLPIVLDTGHKFMGASPCDMFNALVAGPGTGSVVVRSGFGAGERVGGRAGGVGRGDRASEIARRVAHVAVLHWRVWEGIVYQNAKWDEEVDGSRKE